MAAQLTCVVVALAREAMYFRPRLRLRRVRGAPWRAWAGPGVVVVESGMGADAAREAVGWALSALGPTHVVSAGFCGALSEDLPVGAVVLPDEVIDEAGLGGERRGSPPPGQARRRYPLLAGALVSVRRPAATPARRRHLRQAHGAVAVDMESAAVVAACRAAGVPCHCVRAVSDGFRDELSPALQDALEGVRVSWRRLALAAVRRPGVVAELWRLARQSRLAALNLADALQQLLDVPG